MKYLNEAVYKEKYPNNFTEYLISFDCGIGWQILLDELFEYIKDDHNVKIAQVKEKFGLLRIYVDGANEKVYKKISELEHLSSKICEYCGATEDVTTTGSWRKTLCKNCRGAEWKK